MRQEHSTTLKFPDWPAADQAAWKQAVQPGGLFDIQGPAAHWAASTRRSVQYDYGIWLQWCHGQGMLHEQPGRERVTPQTIQHYIEYLQSRVAPVTLHTYLARLHRVITLFHPESDWAWLRQIVNRLDRLKVPSTEKAARMQDSGALLALGQRLMASAALPKEPLPRRERLIHAIQYRDGLMLALLATRPLRRTNFAGIRIDQHLIKQAQTWWLCLQDEETKQGRPIEQPVPKLLQDNLQTYLDTYRQCFPGADKHDYLWVSAKGGPLTDEGVYQRIIKRTKSAFGKPINPHLFRDCAATTIARHTPEQVGIASQVLGHANVDITERHYNQAGSVSASRNYQAALAQIKANPHAIRGKRRQ